MKQYEPKFSKGSLFICSKCGRDFDAPENAEQLKNSLRAELKNENKDHLKIRVMVSSCLGVCQTGDQAVGYYPNEGKLELSTVSNSELKNEKAGPPGHTPILNLIKSKLN